MSIIRLFNWFQSEFIESFQIKLSPSLSKYFFSKFSKFSTKCTWFFFIIRDFQDSTEIRFSTSSSQYDKNDEKKLQPIKGIAFRLRVFFVYSADFDRSRNLLKMSHFWESCEFWLVSSMLLVCSTILYHLRRFINIRRPDFFAGFLEMFTIIFGGGIIRYAHRYEKCFFAVAMSASFFLVSIYMAEFSMRSVVEPKNVDTFGKLAKKKCNISFKLFTGNWEITHRKPS